MVNLKDMSPFKSEHKEGLDDEALHKWSVLFQQGALLQARGEYYVALEKYQQAEKIDDRYAELHYVIGQAEFALGRYDAAEKSFWRAVDEDIAPLRMLSSMRDIVSEVSSWNDVPLVDAEQIIRAAYLRQYDHAVFGKEFFLDHVHLNIEGYRLLGLKLLESLIDQGVVHPIATWNKEQIAAISNQVTACSA